MTGLRSASRRDLGDEQRDADAHRHRDHQRDDADEEACRRSSRRRRTGPWPGSQLSAKTPKPSSRNHGHAFLIVVYAISPRIDEDQQPAGERDPPEQVVGERSRSARARLPRPCGAGAGGSVSRGGAVTAMRVPDLREVGGRAGARDGRRHPSRARPARGHDAGTAILSTCALACFEQALGSRRSRPCGASFWPSAVDEVQEAP